MMMRLAFVLLLILLGCFGERPPLKEVLIISPKRARIAEKSCEKNEGVNYKSFTKDTFKCKNGAIFPR